MLLLGKALAFNHFTSSITWTYFENVIDQYQTTQNVQSDLDQRHLLIDTTLRQNSASKSTKIYI